MLRRHLAGLVALALLAPLGTAHPRQEPLKVVATIPDLADLVARIGGARVEVVSLATAAQNLHAVRIKPSHLVALSRADVFVQVGLSLEHAWVPGLLEAARNRDVAPGGKGFIDAGAGFATIDVPVTLDRSESVDVHPEGNPHVNMSFAGGAHLAANVLAGLIRIAPEHTAEFTANHAAWTKEYDTARTRWLAVAEATRAKGAAVCIVHREFDYLLRDLGLTIAATVEPKPGLAPTPAHLAGVITTAKERGVRAVVTAAWSNDKSVARVSRDSGAGILELPLMVGGSPETGSWIALIDQCVDRLARAVGVDPSTVEARAASGGGPPG